MGTKPRTVANVSSTTGRGSSGRVRRDQEVDRLLEIVSSGPEIPAFSRIAANQQKYPPLESEHQVRLVATYQAAMALKVRVEEGTVPKTQLVAARKTVREGERALHYLVVSNVRLVQLIAREQAVKRFPSRDRLPEMLPDLLNEGNLALTEAVQKYDPERGPFFTAYAARAIRDRVRYVLSREVPVRLSASWSRIQRIAQRTIPDYVDQHGRAPTTEELQEVLLEKCMVWAETKLTAEQQKLGARAKREAKIAKLRKQGMLGAIENITSVLELGRGAASLDAQVGQDGETTLGDMISGDDGGEVFDNIELEQLGATLREALGKLGEREREIMLLRYGFIDDEPWTFERISEKYGVSSERIRQIEKVVLEKLGEGEGGKRLKAFLPGWEPED